MHHLFLDTFANRNKWWLNSKRILSILLHTFFSMNWFYIDYTKWAENEFSLFVEWFSFMVYAWEIQLLNPKLKFCHSYKAQFQVIFVFKGQPIKILCRLILFILWGNKNLVLLKFTFYFNVKWDKKWLE